MNYGDKLQRLRDRRQGFYTKEGNYRFAEAVSTLRKAEKFESLLEPKSVKYALGAMQAVEHEYTQESYAEGVRVAKALLAGLSEVSIPVEFEFQGSVPLDVHVRGNSDVDLLAIHNGFVTHDADVLPAFASTYCQYQGASPLEELKTLRKESIVVLNRRYWGAKVDTSKSCAVTLSEGSFTRVVDVVPSHWHDTFDWKCTKEKHTREIYVLDEGINIFV